MKIFVINTVGNTNQLGIFKGKKVLAEYISEESAKRSGSENLLDISQELFKAAKLAPKDLKLIVVVLGPGSYTGSRAGLAFAKGMAHAGEIEILGVSLFDVVAYANEDTDYPHTIDFDAGNGRFYSKNYESPKEIYTTREAGEIREADTKPRYNNKHIILDHSLQKISLFGEYYYKKNGPDKYDLLLPLYLKEPNITLPKKK